MHVRVTVSWPEVFATAKALSAAHWVGTPCRSLDTLHVALALKPGATEFRTLDLRQYPHVRCRTLDDHLFVPPP